MRKIKQAVLTLILLANFQALSVEDRHIVQCPSASNVMNGVWQSAKNLPRNLLRGVTKTFSKAKQCFCPCLSSILIKTTYHNEIYILSSSKDSLSHLDLESESTVYTLSDSAFCYYKSEIEKEHRGSYLVYVDNSLIEKYGSVEELMFRLTGFKKEDDEKQD